MLTSCNCALPAITGSTECCKNCSANPIRTFQCDKKEYIIPSGTLKTMHTCPVCGCVFLADDANYCPKCGGRLVKCVN